MSDIDFDDDYEDQDAEFSIPLSCLFEEFSQFSIIMNDGELTLEETAEVMMDMIIFYVEELGLDDLGEMEFMLNEGLEEEFPGHAATISTDGTEIRVSIDGPELEFVCNISAIDGGVGLD